MVNVVIFAKNNTIVALCVNYFLVPSIMGYCTLMRLSPHPINILKEVVIQVRMFYEHVTLINLFL